MLSLKNKIDATNKSIPILVAILLLVFLAFIINSINVVNKSNANNFEYTVKVRATTEEIDKIVERAEVNIKTISNVIEETYDTNKLYNKKYNLQYAKKINVLTKAILINTPGVNGTWFQGNINSPFYNDIYSWFIFKDGKIINYKAYLDKIGALDRKITPTDDPYYYEALNSKDTVWSNIYTDADSKTRMITISKSIYKNNKLIGVAGIDISINDIQKALSNMQKVVPDSEIFLLDKKHNILLYQLPHNQKIDNTPLFINEFKNTPQEQLIQYSENKTKKTAILLKLSNKYTIVMVFENSDLYSSFDKLLQILYAIFFIMTILAILAVINKNRILKMNKMLENEMIKLRTVIDSSPNTIVIKNLNGVYVDCNKAFLDITKRPREYFIGKTANETFDAEQAREINEDDNYVIQNKKILKKEFCFKDSLGNTTYVEKYIVPLLSYKDELKGILIIAFDITTQKEEKELLKVAKENAEKIAQMKSNFLANMSHEIRTPMNGVLGFLQLLKETRTTREQAEFINDALKSSELLLQIINDILDFSKMEANKLNIDEIDFDLHVLIDDITIMAASMAQNKNLELNSLICSDIPQNVIGDPIRIKQVLTNIINNAIKFTTSGEVTICVSQIDESTEDCIINFDIKDTGIGIEKNKIDLIFEEFSQADTSTTRKFGGTGLGLAITKKLIQLLDGNINVESEVGKGTTFTVSLPLKKDKNAIIKPPVLLNNLQILAVDSNTTNLKIIDYYLSRTNCIVFKASSTDDIIKIISNKNNNISVVLIDEKMEIIENEKISTLIRNNENFKNVPFIQFSALCHLADFSCCTNKIFEECLTKPINKDDLISAIIRTLNKQGNVTKTNSNNKHLTQKLFNPNSKILIVEDNEINLKLIKKILAQHGLTCDTASNGIDAVEAFKTNSYDLIFMDCQIPIMSGYEATIAIRAIENGVKRVPIIALTANVLADDKEKCFESGMDHYISKPINKNQLLDILTKYLNKSTETTRSVNNANEIINAIISNLEFSQEEAETIFKEYLSLLPQLISEMEIAIENENFEALKIVTHKLKGSSSSLRVNEIATISQEIEKNINDNNNKVCKELINKIKDYAQTLYQVLK